MAKILHIVSEMPPESNAVTEFVCNIAKAQKNAGCDVVIATVAEENLAVSAFEAEELGVRIVRYAPAKSFEPHYSGEMFGNLRKIVHGADTVHIHGTRSFPVRWGAVCSLLEKKRMIVSPHGGMNPMQLSALSAGEKLLAQTDIQFLKKAAVIHAESEMEKEHLLALSSLKKHEDKIIVVSPGVELSRLMPKQQEHTLRTLLFLGELTKNSGLDILLDAVSKCDARTKYKLVICGPDTDGIKAGLEEKVAKLDIGNKVEFREPVAGLAKWRLYREADCFVYSVLSDSFGMPVAEALACGVPAICTRGTPWSVLPESQCGWWCETTADGLAIAIRDMLYHYDEELAAMGERGKKLAASLFSWQAVAAKLI